MSFLQVQFFAVGEAIFGTQRYLATLVMRIGYLKQICGFPPQKIFGSCFGSFWGCFGVPFGVILGQHSIQNRICDVLSNVIFLLFQLLFASWRVLCSCCTGAFFVPFLHRYLVFF